MDVDRKKFESLNLSKVDVIHAIENFDHKYRSTKTTKNISTTLDRDNLIWATDDDSNIKLSRYVRNEFRNCLYK